MVNSLDKEFEKLLSLEDLIEEKQVRANKTRVELNSAINKKAKAEKKIKQRMKKGEKLSDRALDYTFFHYGANEDELSVTFPLIEEFLSIIGGYVGQKILVDYSGHTDHYSCIQSPIARTERKLKCGELVAQGYEITVPDRSLFATATNWRYLDLNEGKWKVAKQYDLIIDGFLEVFIRKKMGSVGPVKIAKELEELRQSKRTTVIGRAGMEITLSLSPQDEREIKFGGSRKYDSPERIASLLIGDKIVEKYLSKLEFQVKTPRTITPGVPA